MSEKLNLNESSVVITIARQNNIEDLVTIRNESLRAKLAHGDTAWDSQPYTADELLPQIERGITRIVLIDGKPAASVDLIWQDICNWDTKGDDGTAGYIHALAVRDEFRGNDLGEYIIDLCAKEVKLSGRGLLRLDCPDANTKLCAYYESLGFVKVGVNTGGNAQFERKV